MSDSRFIENKYYRWYLSITATPDKSDYVERHHIVPRCMGGGNGNNLIALSFRKHFLAHWLLTKCTTGEDKKKMLWAFRYLQYKNTHKGRILSSWQYAVIRQAVNDTGLHREGGLKGGKIGGPKGAQTIRERGIGIWAITPEQRIKNGRKGSFGGQRAFEQSKGIHGMSHEWHVENGRKRGKLSAELGIGLHGMTPEARIKASQKGGKIAGSHSHELKIGIHGLSKEEHSIVARKGGLKTASLGKAPMQQKAICPHCGHENNIPNLKQYHFDKCPHQIPPIPRPQ